MYMIGVRTTTDAIPLPHRGNESGLDLSSHID